MSETRKIAAILVSDVVGYSRLASADEDRTLARPRALRYREHVPYDLPTRDEGLRKAGVAEE